MLGANSSRLCIGCGLCSAVCPRGCIEMKDHCFGEYRPLIEITQCITCNRCIKVCPFHADNPNEEVIASGLFGNQESIQKHSECGYYLEAYVGYSKEHRHHSASGGLTTWLLETLLKDDRVDAVVCVGKGPSSERLFEYKIITEVKELSNCTRSAYYAVELSQVMERLYREERTFAIVGLPCFLKGIRLMAADNPHFASKIKAVVGLVCGHLPSKAMMEYLALSMGRASSEIADATFRIKEEGRSVSDYGVQITWTDGGISRSYGSEEFGFAFFNRLFSQEACDFCDDVFAECADVTLMDAWLLEYENDVQGTSLAIVRSQWAAEIFKKGCGAVLSPIAIENVSASQKGVLHYKRKALYVRCRMARLKGQKLQAKRMQKTGVFEMLSIAGQTFCIRQARKTLRRRLLTVRKRPEKWGRMKKRLRCWVKARGLFAVLKK